jgi:hypothetical protein
MSTGKLQSKRGDGSDKPNVVAELDGDGAPRVLRGDGGAGGAGVGRGPLFRW